MVFADGHHADSHLLQINHAKSKVQHAGFGAIGGGDGENRLPPVFAGTVFQNAGHQQHA